MKKIELRYLDKKIKPFTIERYTTPPGGWIKSIRHTMSIPCQVFASRLNCNLSYIAQLEEFEIGGKIGLNTLKKAADALDCYLVYAFVPKSGTFNDMLSNQAEKVARMQMKNLQHNMLLESQELTEDELDRTN